MKKIIGYLMAVVFLAVLPLQTNAAEITTVNQANINIGELLGIDGKYDTHPVLMSIVELEQLGRLVKELPLLEARLKVKVLPNQFGIPEQEKEIKYYAVGNFIGNGYILSIAHFANANLSLNTPYGPVPVPTEIKEREIFALISGEEFQCKEVKIDFEQDWALFEIPEALKGKYPSLKIGKSNELKPGHLLYFIGSPFNNGTLLRNGIVEAETFDFKDPNLTIDKDDAFPLSGGIYPGDSGGPVVALRDGKLELVGIMKSSRPYTTIGQALKIGPVLEKIKAATGIDLIDLAE